MEPLDETGATGESTLDQEEMVASIRSTMRDLQESVQQLCKASIVKIVSMSQYFIPLPSHLLFPSSSSDIKNFVIFYSE